MRATLFMLHMSLTSDDGLDLQVGPFLTFDHGLSGWEMMIIDPSTVKAVCS
jgi:hypothetical protein